MAKRLYVVAPAGNETPVTGHNLHNDARPRLIRAKTPAGALSFATSHLYSVDVASAEEVAHLVGGGVKVEDIPETV